jgi:hypothetical protein
MLTVSGRLSGERARPGNRIMSAQKKQTRRATQRVPPVVRQLEALARAANQRQWRAPEWILDFTNVQIRPYLKRHQQDAVEALNRYYAAHLREEALLEIATNYAESGDSSAKEYLQKAQSYNAKPLDFPLPLSPGRNYTRDEMLIVMLAVHDATRQPKYRIRSTERGLYRELCRRVQDLRKPDLPQLQRMLVELAAGDSPAPGPGPQTPAKVLSGWDEIAKALERPHRDRDKIKSLNARFQGPIRSSGRGTQPIVDGDLLLAWWNRLTVIQQELANRRQGAALSAEAQYPYGRSGTVAPEIAGSIKPTRRQRPT